MQELEDEADKLGRPRVGVGAADGLEFDGAVDEGGGVQGKAVFLCRWGRKWVSGRVQVSGWVHRVIRRRTDSSRGCRRRASG